MTRMRTFVGVALFAALVCGARAAAEVKVLAASGVVRVAPQGSEVYSAVVPGQVLAEGMMVVTGDDGRVTIAVGPGNTVRLRGNSRLAIKMVEARKSRFQLLAGKIRGVFNGMSGGKRFELEFAGGSAVASVKGTVFTAESGAQLATLNTIYGDIDVTINGQTTPVPQGCGLVLQLTAEGVVGKGGRIEVRILSDTEVSEGLNREGSDGGIRGERSELYIFVNNSGSENSKDREIVNQIMITRGMVPDAPGNVFFSMKALQGADTALAGGLLKGVLEGQGPYFTGPYAKRALVPASPWLDATPPSSPEVRVKVGASGLDVSWTPRGKEAAFLWVVYQQRDGAWTYQILPGARTSLVLETGAKPVTAVAVSAVDRVGNESTRAVSVVEDLTAGRAGRGACATTRSRAPIVK